MDSTSYPEPWQDLSLSAYNRLKQLQNAPVTSSVIHLRQDLQNSSDSSLFLPFIRERDKLGHLLSPLPYVNPPVSMSSGHSNGHVKNKKRLFPPRGRPSKKVEMPSVGTYSPRTTPWIPKSFSTTRLPALPKKTSSTQSISSLSPTEEIKPTELIPTFQYTIKRRQPEPKPKGKFDVLRPEVAVISAKKTNFQSVKLDESPEILGKSWEWPEKRKLKDEKLRVMKEIMTQMKSGRLFL